MIRKLGIPRNECKRRDVYALPASDKKDTHDEQNGIFMLLDQTMLGIDMYSRCEGLLRSSTAL